MAYDVDKIFYKICIYTAGRKPERCITDVLQRVSDFSAERFLAWSGMDVQLQRRFDLIPNLVETVKGYASHESETLANVPKARAAISQAGSVEERMQGENILAGTLKSLFAVAEAYPDLKANENFLGLQNTLEKLEDEIQLSRMYYNGSVRDYNTAIEVFPAVLIANQLGYKKSVFFEAEEASKSVPGVRF